MILGIMGDQGWAHLSYGKLAPTEIHVKMPYFKPLYLLRHRSFEKVVADPDKVCLGLLQTFHRPEGFCHPVYISPIIYIRSSIFGA